MLKTPNFEMLNISCMSCHFVFFHFNILLNKTTVHNHSPPVSGWGRSCYAAVDLVPSLLCLFNFEQNSCS